MSRYSVNLDRMRAFQAQSIAVLADVRGQGNPFSISVWSPGKRKVVKFSYKKRDGKTLITNLTPEAKHWAALSLPRWLVIKEGLLGHADETIHAFCREAHPDHRTADKKDDDAERALSQYVVNSQNRYTALPNQTMGISRRRTAVEAWRNA